MKNSITIIVCTHKMSPFIKKDDIYMPLHVGKVLSKNDLNFQGDNSGDNISIKNKNYCELTGLYWAWKNLNSEYIGLVHYRRYFNLKEKDILKYLQKTDIILVKPHKMIRSAKEQLFHFCLVEDYCIMMQVIKKLYPEYYQTALKYFAKNQCSPYNMFITSRKILEPYCTWLFSIFEEMEKYVRLSSYSRASRLYGYLAENLLTIYCLHNKLKITYKPEIICEKTQKNNLIKNIACDIIFNIRYLFTDILMKREDQILSPNSSFMLGLKNDGIDIMKDTNQ